MMKLSLNYITRPWFRRYSLWLCVFTVPWLAYSLWEREQLLHEYNMVKIAKNDEIQEFSDQPQQPVSQQSSIDPSFEKQMIQISTELTMPRGVVLDSLQMALVPHISLTQISLDDQYVVEGLAGDEKSLQKFIQALQSNPAWESVEIESEELITAENQIALVDQNQEGIPSGQNQTKFTLNLKWKGL
ncbi:PilN domain-containing protein [Acinetobacter dispersus]|uniref:Uncharacterized protein n=1 Tax=Acinetobacter dispersus TaxID=70348 RepID=N9MSY2_9GAMM|nr:PilN domain-containing protein [Acinetobacter dispersus]ENW93024.1 hypothetical protein F904_02967 [Acinetobacter dispersus]